MSNISVDELADAIEEGLKEYGNIATDVVKKSVKSASATVRKEISVNAPKNTGEYAKSWAVKKVKETANALTMVVRSKNRYQIAHLLEHGHAKRNGGRVNAIPHIKEAEKKGEDELVKLIKKGL
jgi:hypothetical protein